VIGGRHDWTWRKVHEESLELANRLDGVATMCNLCGSRVGFLVSWLAAFRRSCLQLLPPSGGHADLVAMLQSSVDPLIVADDALALQPQWTEHARSLIHVPDATSTRIPDDDLAWSPDWDVPLVRLHTSGSTGTPVPQVKTLSQLARGAEMLGEHLEQTIDGGLAALRQIVCSVPPQHMFGEETSVMLSLVHGIPVLDRRPLLPADVRAAFEWCEGGAAWVTTPLHLRAFVQAGEGLPNCRAVIASTMPLAPALAAQAEALIEAPVLEIYGSTEPGAVAMRRTARDVQWRLLQGVRFEKAARGMLVWGEHFTSPQLLDDEIELDVHGTFRLQGRHGDMIKIAGRRASLAGLNQLLQDLPGLADGVFYQPSTGTPTKRLVLIHSGEPLDRGAAKAWLRERIDPVFLPRAIIHVEHLPRTDNGKLLYTSLDKIYATWFARKTPR